MRATKPTAPPRVDGGSIKAAIVNRDFATHFFGNRSPIGRHIGFGGRPNTKLTIEIVGVTDNSLYEGPRDGVHRQVFVPFLESDYPASVAFYVRTSEESKTMFAALRRKIAELDPAMPVFQMKTVDQQLDETLGTERLIATAIGGLRRPGHPARGHGDLWRDGLRGCAAH